MSSAIKQHSCKVLLTKNIDRLCSCRNKGRCPLDDKCLKNVSFTRAFISTMVLVMKNLNLSTITTQIHFAIENFKTFNYTKLSKHIWQVQDKDINFILKWSIAAYASTCRCVSRRCNLSLTEKYAIASVDQKNLLNKRTELISKCRHRSK